MPVWYTTRFELPNHTIINRYEGRNIRLEDNDSRTAESRLDLSFPSPENFDVVRKRYNNVRHPVVDQVETLAVPQGADGQNLGARLGTFMSLSRCHNGLSRIRDRQVLQPTELYYLLVRELAWVQRIPPAFQGPIECGKWWVAPHPYNILAGASQAVHTQAQFRLGDSRIRDNAAYGERSQDVHNFRKATFTLHVVHRHHPAIPGWNYFALLIFRKASGDLWYLDSTSESHFPLPQDQEWRRRAPAEARAEFVRFLRRSGATRDATDGIPDPVEPEGLPKQPVSEGDFESWLSCLHVVLSAVGFVRFGVLSWGNVTSWRIKKYQYNADFSEDGNAVYREVVKSLHNLMGMAYDEAQFGDIESQTPPMEQRARHEDVLSLPPLQGRSGRGGYGTGGRDASLPPLHPNPRPNPRPNASIRLPPQAPPPPQGGSGNGAERGGRGGEGSGINLGGGRHIRFEDEDGRRDCTCCRNCRCGQQSEGIERNQAIGENDRSGLNEGARTGRQRDTMQGGRGVLNQPAVQNQGLAQNQPQGENYGRGQNDPGRGLHGQQERGRGAITVARGPRERISSNLATNLTPLVRTPTSNPANPYAHRGRGAATLPTEGIPRRSTSIPSQSPKSISEVEESDSDSDSQEDLQPPIQHRRRQLSAQRGSAVAPVLPTPSSSPRPGHRTSASRGGPLPGESSRGRGGTSGQRPFGGQPVGQIRPNKRARVDEEEDDDEDEGQPRRSKKAKGVLEPRRKQRIHQDEEEDDDDEYGGQPRQSMRPRFPGNVRNRSRNNPAPSHPPQPQPNPTSTVARPGSRSSEHRAPRSRTRTPQIAPHPRPRRSASQARGSSTVLVQPKAPRPGPGPSQRQARRTAGPVQQQAPIQQQPPMQPPAPVQQPPAQQPPVVQPPAMAPLRRSGRIRKQPARSYR